MCVSLFMRSNTRTIEESADMSKHSDQYSKNNAVVCFREPEVCVGQISYCYSFEFCSLRARQAAAVLLAMSKHWIGEPIKTNLHPADWFARCEQLSLHGASHRSIMLSNLHSVSPLSVPNATLRSKQMAFNLLS